MSRPIPTVDLTRMCAAEAAAAVDRACRGAGFFYVAGHGVAPALEAATFDAMRAFFAAPDEFKACYHIRHSHPHQRGYVPLYEEHLGDDHSPDFKESYDLGVDRAPDHPDVLAGKPFAASNVWPDMPGFRDTVEAYHAEMIRLGDDLVHLTAVGLGLDPDYFDYAMSDPVANLRLLHDPPRARPKDLVGCGSHTDYGFLTVLAQDDVGGLEIEGDGGDWIYVPPLDGACERVATCELVLATYEDVDLRGGGVEIGGSSKGGRREIEGRSEGRWRDCGVCVHHEDSRE